MKDYARSFYKSTAWKKTQASYMVSKHYICERCKGVARIVHHKTYLTPENITDPHISLNWDNLEALCLQCHNKEHYDKEKLKNYTRGNVVEEGLKFNENGELMQTEVFIVWGSPASGKTTYVKNNMQPGDLIVDLDLIKQAISMCNKTSAPDNLFNIAKGIIEYIYTLVENRNTNCDNVWVIAGLPRKKERLDLADRLKAKLIHVDTSKNDCINRAYKDSERLDKNMQIRIINKWFEQYEK